MITRNRIKIVLTLAAVAVAALAIGQVQAESIELNGDFKMYKPGTNYTVRARSDAGNFWVNGIGDNQTVLNNVIVDYDDGTTGTTIDCPGWISPITLPLWRDGADFTTANVQLFQPSEVPDGTSALNCFGAWSGQNGNLAESEPLGVIKGGSYTLSARFDGNTFPLTFELRAGGVALIPSSSVTPVDNPAGWVDISRTYDAASLAGHYGEPMTIFLGTTPPHTTDENDPDRLTGQRGKFDNITLDWENQMNPSPPDGATVPVGDVDLSWTNLDPNIPGDPVYVDVWFGTEPNELHPGYDMIKVVAANIGDPNRTTWTVNAPTAGTYYWRVDSYVNGNPTGDPIKGIVWSFIAVDDLAPTVVIDTPDQITWSGEPVTLNATVTDDGQSALTYAWTAEPPDGVVFDDPGAEDTAVTITKATDNPSTVTLTLAVHDEGNPTPDTDTMEIDVYEDACQLARLAEGKSAQTDFNDDCITNVKDLATMLTKWLVDYKATGPVPKP